MSVSGICKNLSASSLWYPWRLNKWKMTDVHLIADKINFSSTYTCHWRVTCWIGGGWFIVVISSSFHIFHNVFGWVTNLGSFDQRIASLIFRFTRLQIKVSVHCLILLRQMIRCWLWNLIWISTSKNRCVEWYSSIWKNFAPHIIL